MILLIVNNYRFYPILRKDKLIINIISNIIYYIPYSYIFCLSLTNCFWNDWIGCLVFFRFGSIHCYKYTSYHIYSTHPKGIIGWNFSFLFFSLFVVFCYSIMEWVSSNVVSGGLLKVWYIKMIQFILQNF